MKNGFIIFVCFLLIGLLTALYFYMQKKNSIEQGYYPIFGSFYIEKVDHFSDYNIVEKKDSVFVPVLTHVKAIAETKEAYIAEYTDSVQTFFAYFLIKESAYQTKLSAEDIAVFAEPIQNLPFISAIKVAESKTISDKNRLIDSIIIMAIVVISVYLIMKIFNLKRLDR
ncbi:MAG: hypothetical protein LBM67_00495 [Lentimicrobiaceae bacterium]|jgi:hypothetical protein|nr:hypothetical protein [Lentimicrobiaceae bacterium]